MSTITVIVLLLMMCANMSSAQVFTNNRLRQFTPQDTVTIASMRQSGIRKDSSKVSFLMKMAMQPPQQAYAYTAMQALSQIGNIKTLPTFNNYISSPHTQSGENDLRNFARAARARLLAEDATRTIADSRQQAAVKVNKFYSEIGINADGLNAALIAYKFPQPMRDAQGRAFHTVSSDTSVHPLGVYAIRQLADMVYQGNYQDYATLPGISRIDFQDDYPSALKIRLAVLPKQQRLQTLITELSHSTVGKEERNYDLQLAINEGFVASRAAAEELKRMDEDRAAYNQVSHHSGFVSMFYIIAGVGDQEQLPLIEHFTYDSDTWVSHYAKIAYDSLTRGIKRETALAY